MADRHASRWVPPAVAAAVAAIALLALAAHAWQGLSGVYLNHVSGIWLALGQDLAGGLFFRDLAGPAGYGGTRYFPLFFVLIGALLATGIPPLLSGWLASAASGAILATGLARSVRALGAPRHVVWLAAASAISSYFVQQTLFEVRADVLAAGLNLLGLSAALALFRADRTEQVRVWPAAAWFTLALATKVTSLVVPGCVAAALVLSGRVRRGLRFSIGLASGLLAFVALVHVASGGRAIRSWQACMFAGTSHWQIMESLLAGDFVALVSYSHLLIALLGLASLAIVLALGFTWRERRRRETAPAPRSLDGPTLWLPVALFAGVTASTAFTLSGPGAVASNHVVEWLGISLWVLAWAAAARAELRLAGSAALAVLVVWMSAQNVARASHLWQSGASSTSAAARSYLVDRISKAPAPVLSESALWPVLAGRPPVLLDAFALRVVLASRPDIACDLETRIGSRSFPLVIFQVDPTSDKGRRFYQNEHFGWPVTSRILASYRFESHPAANIWIYVPGDGDGR